MASNGEAWTLTQIGGANKVLTLADWSAPFGRPRVGAVVRTGIEVRSERVFYPGSDVPTRHTFGVKLHDWELKGRFMDRAMGGTGKAQEKAAEVVAFLRDKLPCRIAWGDVFAFHGFLKEFDPGHESKGQIDWTMKLEIDTDLSNARPPSPPAPPSPQASLAQINLALLDFQLAADDRLPGDLLDLIDSLVSVLTDAVATLADAVGQIADFKNATFAQINRVLSAVDKVRGLGVQLFDTFASLPGDVAAVGGRAKDVTDWQRKQFGVTGQLNAMMGANADIEYGCNGARIGRTKATYVARAGDTWESVSTASYSTPARAGDIQIANDVPAGQKPRGGVEYLIPK